MIDREIKAGDLIGFSGNSWQSAVIAIGTYGIPRWGLTHVGVVADVFDEDRCLDGTRTPDWSDRSFRGPFCARIDKRYDKLGPPISLLFESTTGCDLPCEINGRVIDGTQAHDIWSRVEGYDGKVWHYPYRYVLSPIGSIRFTNFLLKNCRKEYDTIGAIRSGGLALSWLESLLRDEDLTSLFCSEYVAAAYDHVNILDLKSASRWNPARLVRYMSHYGFLAEPRRLK